MNKVDVILGLQWGDEGKGKVVDVLTPRYQAVARFQGGPNAGHTLEFNGEKYVLRSIPSGIFQGGKTNIIGNGVVLDPILFREEATALAKSGHDLKGRLQISKKAHLILPTHRMLDAAQEAAKGSARIGTTGKGIGPTYTDKVSRTGMRVGDVLGPEFRAVYDRVKARHEATLRSLGYVYDIAELERQWFDAVEYLKEFRLIDSEYEINRLLAEGQPSWPKGPRVRCWTSISAPILSSPPPIRFVPVPARVSASLLRVSARCSVSSRLIVPAWGLGRSRPSCSMKRAPVCGIWAMNTEPLRGANAAAVGWIWWRSSTPL